MFFFLVIKKKKLILEYVIKIVNVNDKLNHLIITQTK